MFDVVEFIRQRNLDVASYILTLYERELSKKVYLAPKFSMDKTKIDDYRNKVMNTGYSLGVSKAVELRRHNLGLPPIPQKTCEMIRKLVGRSL
jgi:hypothetical protein